MAEVLSHIQFQEIQDYAEQLADLTRTAWTGCDGKCYFPYMPLTQTQEWKTRVASDWADGHMHSWALLHEGTLVAHAALVQKAQGTWELGRWVAYRNAPRGSVTRLCEAAMTFARKQSWRARVECTQAHVFSQRICEHLGMRPAGYGFLDRIDGIAWDIIYYDTDRRAPFEPEVFDDPTVIGDPLGNTICVDPAHRTRVQEIAHRLITSDPGGDLPPTRFHILAHRADILRRTLTRVLEDQKKSR